jgi:nuclear pore complex protein Nup155
VTLVAVSWDSETNTTKLIPTAYKLPTENVTVVKVQGSQSGRIFLAGNDGNLYELDYQSTDSPWSIVFGTERTHKCRKINHSVTEWKILRMLPPFLRSQQSANDSLVDLIIDNVRNVLYSTSLSGNIGVFYLGDDPRASVAPPVVTEFNVITAAQKFSLDQKSKNLPYGEDFSDIRSLSVVGVYVVPLTESRIMHLVAFLNSGSRIYLRLFSISLAGSGTGTGSEKVPFSVGGTVLPPTGIEVVSIRYAPSADNVR